MSDSLWPHGLRHTRLPCPSPSPRVSSNSRALSQWCHPIISSSVIPFSSCPQSFPDHSLFQWVSSSHHVAKVLELQLQHQSFQWIFRVIPIKFFRMDWLDPLDVQETLKSLLQHHSSKTSVLLCSAFFMVQLAATLSLDIPSSVTLAVDLLWLGLEWACPQASTWKKWRWWSLPSTADPSARCCFWDVTSWPLHAGDLHASFWAAWLESSTFWFLLRWPIPPTTCHVGGTGLTRGASLLLMLRIS